MTPQDALAAVLHEVLCGCGDHGEADYIEYTDPIIAALARDGWVLVNAETLAEALAAYWGWGSDSPVVHAAASAILAALRGDTDA